MAFDGWRWWDGFSGEMVCGEGVMVCGLREGDFFRNLEFSKLYIY